MDLCWSKPKKLSFAQLQQLSYLKSLHGAVGNEKLNFDSQFFVLQTNWGKKSSFFSCDSVRLFHNDLICISWMNKNVEICRHSLLLLCSSRMQTKGCWKASQISWQHGLRPPGDLGNIQCERKHVTHEQLEIDFGCQWSPTRVSSSSK